ncbi:MAG TPA: metalloregulator ArsR/SmtB family transcription factor [Ilumatobacteraceae bacterium]|nr:metalloregulator ArsR/SmtB family transcription factor [Ilumatobacteraceae bacterium]
MDVNMKSDARPALVSCCGSVAGDALTDAQATELAAALKVLADPVRLRLVSIIATSPTGEVCACDLPDSLDRSQPTVSHHLTLLVNAGVLEREQRGKWAWFRLRHERLDELAAVLSSHTDRTPQQSGSTP